MGNIMLKISSYIFRFDVICRPPTLENVGQIESVYLKSCSIIYTEHAVCSLCSILKLEQDPHTIELNLKLTEESNKPHALSLKDKA